MKNQEAGSEEMQPSKFQSVQVTQVSNGFITELSSSSQPNQDAQQRAYVHKNIDELVSYLQTTFA